MEMEEKLLKIVDVDQSQEKAAKSFLQKLKNFKVENLKKETLKIKEIVANLDETTQESAFVNYQAFINSSKSSRIVLQRWSDVTHNVDNLTNKIPNFASNCDGFFKSSYELDSSCDDLTLAEEKHVDILNILELPKLMEMSIQKEEYDNALELASYIQKLNSKLPNAILIESVIKTIESSWYVMISQLLMELRSDDLTLTKSLQLVGFLRRMQAFTSTELKMKFLQERGFWLEDLLSKIPKNDAYQHLIRTIEITRINLFNVITQFKALFDVDSSKDIEKNTHFLINSWVHEKLENFLKTLESDMLVGNINITDFVAIMNQCMYFGSSFSRIGYDFRAQIAPIFIRAISKSIKTTIQEATLQFELDMEAFTLINRDIMRVSKSNESEEGKAANHPPESILDFYPLAAYTNKLLILFNELRICVPLACAKTCVSSINQSLESATRCILNFLKNEQQAFSKREHESFLRLCTCFCYEFFPYIQQCILQVFQRQMFSNVESLLTLSKEPIDRLLHLSDSSTLKNL